MQNVLSLTIDADAGDRFTGIRPGDLSDNEQESLIRLALSVLQMRHRPGTKIDNPNATREYLQLRLSDRPNEMFGAMFLDTRHRVLCIEELFQGTVSGASVFPRLVVQRALACNANAAVFFHNHPSGVPEPSMADQKITQRLKDALALIDVRVLDHVVVGAEGTVSFAETGLL